MRVVSLVLSAVCLAGASSAAQHSAALGAPETFSAQAQVMGVLGAAAAPIKVVIQRYTPDAERTALEAALASGGHSAFLSALRKASDVGYVEHGTTRFTIRYAREATTDQGRRIDLVTDRPIFFVGGGAPEARPRESFDVAVLRMHVDVIGFGSGVMAAAARVNPAPDGGVQIDDYAEHPIKLVAVTRKLS